MDKTSRPDWGGAPLAGEADGARGYVHVAVGEERQPSRLCSARRRGALCLPKALPSRITTLPGEVLRIVAHGAADLARDARSLQQQGDRRVSDYAPRGTWRTRL